MPLGASEERARSIAEAVAKQGFHVERGLFSAAEARALTDEADRLLRSAVGGDYASRVERQIGFALGPEAGTFQAVLTDPRFLDVARARLGADALASFPWIERSIGDTGWHRDARFAETRAIKMVMYLEPVGPESGALRFAAGGFDGGMAPAPVGQGEGAVHVCSTEPGDLIFFDPRMWHASFNGPPLRRYAAWMYWKRPVTDAERARHQHGMRRGRADWQVLGARGASPQPWIYNPGNDPLRATWNAQIEELGMSGALSLTEGADGPSSVPQESTVMLNADNPYGDGSKPESPGTRQRQRDPAEEAATFSPPEAGPRLARMMTWLFERGGFPGWSLQLAEVTPAGIRAHWTRNGRTFESCIVPRGASASGVQVGPYTLRITQGADGLPADLSDAVTKVLRKAAAG